MDNFIILPVLGNEITEAEVNEWLKAEGDAVEQGEQIVSITTSKTNVDLEAPATGILEKILVPAGELAAVGATIGIIRS